MTRGRSRLDLGCISYANDRLYAYIHTSAFSIYSRSRMPCRRRVAAPSRERLRAMDRARDGSQPPREINIYNIL